MKSLYKSIALGLLAAVSLACDPDLPRPHVLPDPILEKNGIQRLTTISIYESHEIMIPVTRVFGISKELSLALKVAPEKLAEYNTLYSTSYEQLPEEYYSIEDRYVLAAGVKAGNIPVTIFTKKLISDKGREAAEKYYLPLEMICENHEIDDPASMGSIMICLKIDDPTVEIEGSESRLSFTPLSSDTQEVQIAATTNFTTLDVDKVTYVADEARVAEYNQENGTSFALLPEGKYTVCRSEFNSADCSLSTKVILDCASLGTTGQYLLPLVLSQNAGYSVNQKAPAYIAIDLTDFKVWIMDTDVVSEVPGNEGTLTVATNAPINEDVLINLVYNPSRINQFNQDHGTHYVSLETTRISSTPAILHAGEMSVDLSYAVDTDNLTFADYALCFEIDVQCLPAGAVVPAGSIALRKVSRSIAGEYDVTLLDNGKFKNASHNGTLEYNSGWRHMKGRVYLAPEFHRSFEPLDSKYSVAYSENWDDGIAFFDVDTEQIPGKSGCYAIINLRDRYNAANEAIGFSMDYRQDLLARPR